MLACVCLFVCVARAIVVPSALSIVRLINSHGIVPDNELAERSSSASAVSLPNDGGIVPVSKLPDKSL